MSKQELCTLRLTCHTLEEVANHLIRIQKLLTIVLTPQTIMDKDLGALGRIGALATSVCVAGITLEDPHIKDKLIQMLSRETFPYVSKLVLLVNSPFGLEGNEYDLCKVVRNLPEIKELVSLGNDFNIMSILQAASKGYLKDLQSLNLVMNAVDDIQFFLISPCAITGCFPKLEDLDLRGNNITYNGLVCLACISQSCLPELREIDLSYNKDLDETDHLGAFEKKATIASILNTHSNVTVLNMMNCNMDTWLLRSLSKAFPEVRLSFPNIAYMINFTTPQQLLMATFERTQSIFSTCLHCDDSDDSEDEGCVVQ